MKEEDKKSIYYGKTIKPMLKRMYAIVDEKKKLNKEFKELTATIKRMNFYLIGEE